MYKGILSCFYNIKRCMERKTAAWKLERMICDAICEYDEEAIRWLGAKNRFPPVEQGGFYDCCAVLNIDASQLHKTIKSAFNIVPTSEPNYSEDYEIHNSKRSSEDLEMQRRVCAKIVPFTRKRQKAY